MFSIQKQQIEKQFYGQQIGELIVDTSSSDHCIVMVRVPFCSFCRSLVHTMKSCRGMKCSGCKKTGHLVKECPIRCLGCKGAGHVRKECKSSPCTHCGGHHAYIRRGERVPSCPILMMAREGASLEKIVTFIKKEFKPEATGGEEKKGEKGEKKGEKELEAFERFQLEVQEAETVFDAEPVKRIDIAKTVFHITLTDAIRRFILGISDLSPEEITHAFAQRLQPLLVVSACHYSYPESHRFSSTVPGLSEGDASRGVHYGSIHTIKARQGYRAQPSKIEALSLVFLTYRFSVDTYLSKGTGVPQGC